MKRFLVFLLAFSFVATSFASGALVIVKPKKADEIMIPIGNTGQKISLLDLAQIKVKDFEALSGRHLSLVDKIGFKLAQRQLQKSINSDGTVNNKKLKKYLDRADVTTGFNIGGFALGFLLGLIGVLIAYLINDDKKSARVKCAWIGFAVWIVILIILLVA